MSYVDKRHRQWEWKSTSLGSQPRVLPHSSTFHKSHFVSPSISFHTVSLGMKGIDYYFWTCWGFNIYYPNSRCSVKPEYSYWYYYYSHFDGQARKPWLTVVTGMAASVPSLWNLFSDSNCGSWNSTQFWQWLSGASRGPTSKGKVLHKTGPLHTPAMCSGCVRAPTLFLQAGYKFRTSHKPLSV